MEELMLALRRKQGSWIDWAKACQALLKEGVEPQRLFEETGVEPIHQNQMVVALQVYEAIAGWSEVERAKRYFQAGGSEVLYELRVLNQEQRLAAMELVMRMNLDAGEAKELARALREVARLTKLPEGFEGGSGDRVALYCWRMARQQADLKDRSRLIARGLRFAETQGARKQLEKLLTDFQVERACRRPPLPFFRLENETEMPRIIPCLGIMPLKAKEVALDGKKAMVKGPFNVMTAEREGRWVALPGWQVVLRAKRPVAILASHGMLDEDFKDKNELILMLVDADDTSWTQDSHFLVDRENLLNIQWFEEEPQERLLGKVILALKPKKTLEQDQNFQLWGIDE